jgi:hypothetical protein
MRACMPGFVIPDDDASIASSVYCYEDMLGYVKTMNDK